MFSGFLIAPRRATFIFMPECTGVPRKRKTTLSFQYYVYSFRRSPLFEYTCYNVYNVLSLNNFNTVGLLLFLRFYRKAVFFTDLQRHRCLSARQLNSLNPPQRYKKNGINRLNIYFFLGGGDLLTNNKIGPEILFGPYLAKAFPAAPESVPGRLCAVLRPFDIRSRGSRKPG